MLRTPAIEHKLGFEEGFRWRGREPNRFEGFSDAVFAFSMTLLVVSLEVPDTYSELIEGMRGFIGFAACFTILMLVWYQQYIYFRRYGLQDITTIALNSALLFVVLFYVYPLKFIFRLISNQITGHGVMIHTHAGKLEPMIAWSDTRELMLIYSAGFIAVYAIFGLMFRHAQKLAGELELNDVERYDTATSVQSAAINVAIGVLSIAMAMLLPGRLVGLSGWMYFLLGPSLGFHGAMRGKRRAKMREVVPVETEH
jgi:hypothetical protein